MSVVYYLKIVGRLKMGNIVNMLRSCNWFIRRKHNCINSCLISWLRETAKHLLATLFAEASMFMFAGSAFLWVSGHLYLSIARYLYGLLLAAS